MKIAMLASSYPRHANDGSARFNHSIAESLTKLGHSVHVVVPYSQQIRSFKTPVKIHTFQYSPTPKLNIMGYGQAMENDKKLNKMAYLLAPTFFLSEFLTLFRVVKQYNIDIIHAHWVVPNGFVAALIGKFLKKPVYLSLHGSDIFFALRHGWMGRLAKWTFLHSEGVTVCSPELYRGAMKLGADRTKLFLIPWGADPEQFGDRLMERTAIRKKYRWHNDDVVLVGLGRMVGKKGFSILLQALAILQKTTNSFNVLLLGDGPEKRHLQQLARDLDIDDKVSFTGDISWADVPGYLAAADILVMPSIHDNGNVDGLPTVILEAMSAGKPIIASDVGGISMVVKDGVNGYLVPEKSPEYLANAIKKIIEQNSIFEMGQQSRYLVENKYNWLNVARSIEALYLRQPIPLQVNVTMDGKYNETKP